MGVLATILYIVLFLLFLSLLVLIHELGHFAMCKAFKVYVFEFSIGMGPLLFKKKKGETQYSLRAIPFGGYVSMYDGEQTLPEGVEIDPARSMENTKKWKKAIIFVAGVTMNIVLAFVMYFVSSWIPKKQFYVNYVNGVSGLDQNTIYNVKQYGSSVIGIDEHAIVHFDDETTRDDVIAAMELANFTFEKTELVNYLNFYYPVQKQTTDKNGNISMITTIEANNVVDISKVSYIEFKLDCLDREATKQARETDPNAEIYGNYVDCRVDKVENNKVYKYEGFDVKFAIEVKQSKNLGESLQKTVKGFGNGASIIFKSLGMLITKPGETISQSGGIIAIGFESTNILKNRGWSYYIELWGMISINLAIINILPFPGLDGWHLVVLGFEAITKKKMPNKVKNIVAVVGIVILFSLMIALLFKDAFRYIFKLGVSVLL